MPEDIYVMVAENDQPLSIGKGKMFVDDGGPIVHEQYTRSASLDQIKKRIAQLGGKYGKCRIAKLQFIDEE